MQVVNAVESVGGEGYTEPRDVGMLIHDSVEHLLYHRSVPHPAVHEGIYHVGSALNEVLRFL